MRAYAKTQTVRRIVDRIETTLFAPVWRLVVGVCLAGALSQWSYPQQRAYGSGSVSPSWIAYFVSCAMLSNPNLCMMFTRCTSTVL